MRIKLRFFQSIMFTHGSHLPGMSYIIAAFSRFELAKHNEQPQSAEHIRSHPLCRGWRCFTWKCIFCGRVELCAWIHYGKPIKK